MFALIAADDFLLAGGTGLIDAYRASGRSVEFHLLDSSGHGIGLGKPRSRCYDPSFGESPFFDSTGGITVTVARRAISKAFCGMADISPWAA